MKTTTMKKKKDNKIILKAISINDIPKGHQEHQSGAGKHNDKRTKRMKTRNKQFSHAMKEWE